MVRLGEFQRVLEGHEVPNYSVPYPVRMVRSMDSPSACVLLRSSVGCLVAFLAQHSLTTRTSFLYWYDSVLIVTSKP